VLRTLASESVWPVGLPRRLGILCNQQSSGVAANGQVAEGCTEREAHDARRDFLMHLLTGFPRCSGRSIRGRTRC
jgi:hypothetical protein